MKQKNTVVVKTVVAIAAMAAALCGVADGHQGLIMEK